MKVGLMLQYRCAGCGLRLRLLGPPANLVGDLCPECDSLLEPVVDAGDLVGYRSISPVQADTVGGQRGSRTADLHVAATALPQSHTDR